jgi:hypothetical protein
MANDEWSLGQQLQYGVRLINDFFPPLLSGMGFKYTFIASEMVEVKHSRLQKRLLDLTAKLAKKTGKRPDLNLPTQESVGIIASLDRPRRKNPKHSSVPPLPPELQRAINTTQWVHSFEKGLIDSIGDIIIRIEKVTEFGESFMGLTMHLIQVPAVPEDATARAYMDFKREIDQEWSPIEYGDTITVLNSFKITLSDQT